MQQSRFSLWSRSALVALLITLLLFAAGCEWSSLLDNDDEDDVEDSTPPAADTDIAGLNVAVASDDVDTVFNQLRTDIGAQTGLTVQVDHQANADSVGRTLRPTRVIVFDNPARSAPLIQADARAGLDLPAKVLVYQDGDGDTAVAYNDPDYLAARYSLGDVGDALDAMGENLRTLTIDAAGGNEIAREGSSAGISEGEGIENVESDSDFATTVNRLTTAIGNRDNLTLIDQIDQQANAAQVGSSLNPSTLLIFGNPDAGTPLLRASQTIGIDLPQKMLVSQADDGTVSVYYNAPEYIAGRHDIDGQDERLDNIADTLADLTDQATSTDTTATTTTSTP